MSKPQYLRHDKSPAAIVVVTEEVLGYLFTITNNEKQFPKAYRYTLVTDIRNTCLKLHKNVYRALAVRPRFQEQVDERRKYQRKVYNQIVDLKALMIIAFKVANVSNREYVAKLLHDLVEAYNRWIKNDKRNLSKLPTKEQYQQIRENARIHRKEEHAAFANLEHDDDGFVMLKKTSF